MQGCVPHDSLLVAQIEAEEARHGEGNLPAETLPRPEREEQPDVDDVQQKRGGVERGRVDAEKSVRPIRINDGGSAGTVEAVRGEFVPAGRRSPTAGHVYLLVIIG